MDVVVTLPLGGLPRWIAEGDAVGEEESGDEWDWYCWGRIPPMKPGDKVYVVHNRALRGYAPLVRIQRYGHGSFSFVRKGGAVAVTIAEEIPGFRGWRERWWKREDEIPFPDWQDPEACIGWMRPPKKGEKPRTRAEMYTASEAWVRWEEAKAHEPVVTNASIGGLWEIEEADERTRVIEAEENRRHGRI